jgi:NADPH:quinone reductase-like Zn-dependent oxidoreductase
MPRMKAARIVEFADPSKLRIVELEKPHSEQGQALVAVWAAGINPSDISNLAGRFEQTSLPRTPGRDFAGVVVEGPRELVGTRVWGTDRMLGFTLDGTHAEFVVVPPEAARPKPKNLSMEQSAISLPFVTAWLAVNAAELKAGETFVVTGCRGSVGSAAVQIARWRGANTIGVQRGTEKRYTDRVIDSEREEVVQRIKELTGGKGADACLDTVGGPFFDAALAGLGQHGRFVAIPATKDGRVTFNLREFYHRELRLIGVDSLKLATSVTAAALDELGRGFDSGALRPPVVRAYPLSRAPEAYAELASGKSSAKLVLTPGG